MVATFAEFSVIVNSAPKVVDIKLDDKKFHETNGGLFIGDHSLSALALYQIASMTKLPRAIRIDQTNFMTNLPMIVDHFNANREALSLATGRTVNGGYLGGVVSSQYAPVTHAEMIAKMADEPAFNECTVVNFSISPERLEATILLNDAEWAVDGGLKAGLKIQNGQFGSVAFGYSAMLFRLRCTNGLMDKLASHAVNERHVRGKIDLTKISTMHARALEMKTIAESSMEDHVDIMGTMIELVRRGVLTVTQAKKALSHRIDLGHEGDVAGGENRWSLAQAISAASRDYSFTTLEKLQSLSGRIVLEGLPVIMDANPIKVGAPTEVELAEKLAA